MKTSTLLPDKAGYTQGTLIERASFFPDVPTMPFQVRCVNTLDDFIDFVYRLERQSWFSFDTETTSINPRQAKLVGMSFCWDRDEAWYVPVACPRGDRCLSCKYILENINHVLENTGIKKLGQNIKYDKIVLKNYGIDLQGIVFDTLIASYLLDAGSRRHNLDLLAKKYLNYETIHLSSLIGSGKSQLHTYDVPLECMSAYAAEDAWVVAKLAPILYKEAQRQGLTKLLDHVEIPLISVLANMEYDGVLIDKEKLSEIQRDFNECVTDKLDGIKNQAGSQFNPRSSKQLREELFGRLLLPSYKNTPGGEPSTDKSVLDELAKQHELPDLISEYREYTKLLGTYVDPFFDMVYHKTGRIHGSFNQAVTATGRLSSSNPNLQNIPARTDHGKKIRKVFVAPKDHILLSADYSQIELRVLAHYTGDPRLLEAFESGEDIHAIVASQVGEVSLDEVTDQMRKAAKTINFGILYGQGPKKLAAGIGVNYEAAKTFIEQYYRTYPTIRTFKNTTINFCRRNGYVSTILGRRRYIPSINEPDGPDRWEAERMAVNTVIQGSAADMIKLAMLEINNLVTTGILEAKMLLQVHDELVFEVPTSKLAKVCEIVESTMSHVVPLKVPLKVDLECGKSWGDMVTYEHHSEEQQGCMI